MKKRVKDDGGFDGKSNCVCVCVWEREREREREREDDNVDERELRGEKCLRGWVGLEMRYEKDNKKEKKRWNDDNKRKVNRYLRALI